MVPEGGVSVASASVSVSSSSSSSSRRRWQRPTPLTKWWAETFGRPAPHPSAQHSRAFVIGIIVLMLILEFGHDHMVFSTTQYIHTYILCFHYCLVYIPIEPLHIASSILLDGLIVRVCVYICMYMQAVKVVKYFVVGHHIIIDYFPSDSDLSVCCHFLWCKFFNYFYFY